MEMQKRNYKNEELNVQMNCYIDKNNELWFRAKEIALILEYKDTKRAIQKFVHPDDKKLMAFKVKVNSTLTESPNSRGHNLSPLAESLKKTYKCFLSMNLFFTH